MSPRGWGRKMAFINMPPWEGWAGDWAKLPVPDTRLTQGSAFSVSLPFSCYLLSLGSHPSHCPHQPPFQQTCSCLCPCSRKGFSSIPRKLPGHHANQCAHWKVLPDHSDCQKHPTLIQGVVGQSSSLYQDAQNVLWHIMCI